MKSIKDQCHWHQKLVAKAMSVTGCTIEQAGEILGEATEVIQKVEQQAFKRGMLAAEENLRGLGQ